MCLSALSLPSRAQRCAAAALRCLGTQHESMAPEGPLSGLDRHLLEDVSLLSTSGDASCLLLSLPPRSR